MSENDGREDVKSREQAEKFFWMNAAKIYKWTRRLRDQPVPAKAL